MLCRCSALFSCFPLPYQSMAPLSQDTFCRMRPCVNEGIPWLTPSPDNRFFMKAPNNANTRLESVVYLSTGLIHDHVA